MMLVVVFNLYAYGKMKNRNMSIHVVAEYEHLLMIIVIQRSDCFSLIVRVR